MNAKAVTYYVWPLQCPKGTWTYKKLNGVQAIGEFKQSPVCKFPIFKDLSSATHFESGFNLRETFTPWNTSKEAHMEASVSFAETPIPAEVLAKLSAAEQAWLTNEGIATLEGAVSQGCMTGLIRILGRTELFPDLLKNFRGISESQASVISAMQEIYLQANPVAVSRVYAQAYSAQEFATALMSSALRVDLLAHIREHFGIPLRGIREPL